MRRGLGVPAMVSAAAMFAVVALSGIAPGAHATPAVAPDAAAPIRVPDPFLNPPAGAEESLPPLAPLTPPGEGVFDPPAGQEYELAFFVVAGVLTLLLVVGVIVLFLKFDRDPGDGADDPVEPGEPRG